VIGLFGLYNYLKNKISYKNFDFWVNNPALLFMLFLMIFTPSVLFNIARDIYLFKQSDQYNLEQTFYISDDFSAAAKFLYDQPHDKIILAADIPAKFIPSMTGQSVYIAHAHETLFYYAKLNYLFKFYANDDDPVFKEKFLRSREIDYVLFSDYEKELGGFDPSSVDFLNLVFDSTSVKIYSLIID